MSPILYAIAPIFALIFVGFGLRRINFPSEGFWTVSERLTYFVLLPALLVHGLSGRSIQANGVPIAGAALFAVLSVALLTRLVWPILKINGPSYTSLFQGAFRPNTYVGMSVAAALLGPDWMTLSAIAILSMTPAINVICVLALLQHGDCKENSFKEVLLALVKNPLIVACLMGLSVNMLGLDLSRVLNDLLDILGRAALPMGLLAAGAGLRFEKMKGGKRSLVVSSVLHLLFLPIVAGGLCNFFGGDKLALQTVVIYTAVPVSVSSFILSRQMGGNYLLMAQIITFQTMVSMITLPMMLIALT